MMDIFSYIRQNKEKLTQGFVFFVLGIFYLFTRFFLFVREGVASFGYDTGIYRHYIDGYFTRLHDSELTPFAFSGYSNFLKALGVSTDHILITWYFGIAIFLFVIFFCFVKSFTNTWTALIALFLFSVSIVQYEFFWWFYYRNFISFGLVFVSLILFHFRSFLVIFPLMALGTLHVLTLIPVGLTMMVLWCVQKQNRKYYLLSGSIVLLGIIGLNFQEFSLYFTQAKQIGISGQNLQSEYSEFNGQFIDGWFFLKYTFFVLVLGLIGSVKYYKKYPEMALLGLFSLIPLLLGILFYRRFFVFLDVCTIFFASVFVFHSIQSYKSVWVRSALGIGGAVLIFLSINFVVHKQPVFTREELAQVQKTNDLAPARLLSISSGTAPWLYGFTHHQVIAPGLFEHDVWTESEWQEFWTTQNLERRHDLLNRYSSPVYIFVAESERRFESTLAGDAHFVQRQPFLWEYIP